MHTSTGGAALLLTLTLTLVVGIGLVAAPAALAHGGQFRGPGVGPRGPGLTPSVPQVPQTITPGETWQTWWDLNRLGLIPGRDVALGRQVVTPREGDDEISLEESWAHRRALVARQTVIPFLLRLVDPKQPTRDEVRAAALIALGKVGSERVIHPVFIHFLHDDGSSDVVRESAALAIGLLRRTKASLQQSGASLDGLREELIRAVDDKEAHVRVRAFAALGLGLLADQPYGGPYTKDGRLVVRALWKRLGQMGSGYDLPIALLTSLGLQPAEGVSDEIRTKLHEIVAGKRVFRRRWTSMERSHALTASLHLGGSGAHALLLRLLKRAGEHQDLRRAAYLALGRVAAKQTPEQRGETAVALMRSIADRRDPLTNGLALVAAGRLLGADLRDGSIAVLDAAPIGDRLLDLAKNGGIAEHGWAVLGLALAARGALDSGSARPFLEKARVIVLRGIEFARGGDRVRAAHAVGAGLLSMEEAVPALLRVVQQSRFDPVLRGHAAVALGQIGKNPEEVRDALMELLTERRGVLLRVRAAMGLALLGGRLVRTKLLEELRDAESEYHRAHVVIALGRLGDLGAASELLRYAKDERYTELARALAVVSLGLLVDPEPRPSILRLTQDANYPAATNVLYSAWSIF